MSVICVLTYGHILALLFAMQYDAVLYTGVLLECLLIALL